MLFTFDGGMFDVDMFDVDVLPFVKQSGRHDHFLEVCVTTVRSL